ncbi:kinesin-like protein Klp2 [Schizosaccharomyces japonicus yFS275]|uniref:Kinesin-like protein n=1 Tax=Schizosaccharomyces japonicus (strain yFS275 / FY16936) TaxID=402676 RepID=B6JYF2_SCHJY|nr:kinesin-like protein Klp2 [Schizosaccharomyces japonicus yFS275]EEB06570.2 kinesin-like protein Klp2 [Schizosaccharomyces japonicus yFS275]
MENRRSSFASRLPQSTKSMSPNRPALRDTSMSSIPPPTIRAGIPAPRVTKPRISLSTLSSDPQQLKSNYQSSKMPPPTVSAAHHPSPVGGGSIIVGKTRPSSQSAFAPPSATRPKLSMSRPSSSSSSGTGYRSVSVGSRTPPSRPPSTTSCRQPSTFFERVGRHSLGSAAALPSFLASNHTNASSSNTNLALYPEAYDLESPTTPLASAAALSETEARLRAMEEMYTQLSQQIAKQQERDSPPSNDSSMSTTSSNILQQQIDMLQSSLLSERKRFEELQARSTALITEKAESDAQQIILKKQIESLLQDLENTRTDFSMKRSVVEQNHQKECEQRDAAHAEAMERLRREHELNCIQLEQKAELERQRIQQQHLADVERIQQEANNHISQVKLQQYNQTHELQAEHEQMTLKHRQLQAAHEQALKDLEVQKKVNADLQNVITEQKSSLLAFESEIRAVRGKVTELETANQKLRDRVDELQSLLQNNEQQRDGLVEKLLREETLRRQMHNTIQELKGNIRVFCRLRPAQPQELEADGKIASITFPRDNADDMQSLEIVTDGPTSSLGGNNSRRYPFTFDRVFPPETTNEEVFTELSQLIQSAMDGYNVCIFAYGQTGSGKTYTMSSRDGMIPRAVRMIYSKATNLQERGWMYEMHGQFLEIYNETINDLLDESTGEDAEKKRYEIYHDTKEGRTMVTNLTTEVLDSPERVSSLLERSSRNRSVASTNANERSSRSHSVFMLHLHGENAMTGESCRGTLNLIDLAGSERLAHSQSSGERLKETQAINKSLSSLGDVIHALGSGREGVHVPYRNSKLTNLLQYSLGGNSKTLMFVNISPLQQHVSETLCSLRFATKVNNTQIGTARRVSR